MASTLPTCAALGDSDTVALMLDVEEWGQGPAVVLLHGMPHPISDYAPVIERLRGTHRVIAPYLPGYGKSPRLTPYELPRVRDLIIDALAARGVQRASVVGFSQGVLHALALALDPRLDVTSVVALAGHPGYRADEPHPQTRGFIATLRAGADLTSPQWRAMAAGRFTAKPEFGEAVAGWLSIVPADVLADEMEGALAIDLRPRLAEIRVPVHVRVGDRDPAVLPATARQISDGCPHGTLEIVPGLGHAQCLEDPSGTAEYVARAVG